MLKIFEVAVAHKSSKGAYGIFFFFLSGWLLNIVLMSMQKAFTEYLN